MFECLVPEHLTFYDIASYEYLNIWYLFQAIHFQDWYQNVYYGCIKQYIEDVGKC